MNDTVEELKRFNARRKLKGAVQAIASGVSLDPLCNTDIDAGMNDTFSYLLKRDEKKNHFHYIHKSSHRYGVGNA